jgi:hypothetical protein
MAVMAAAIYILSSISYTQLNTPFSARGTMEIFTMRTVVYFGGVALLFAYQSQLRDLLTQREADALRNMLHIQYENYKIRQESIDLINQKYHDLKHQIAVLRAESGEKRNAVLDNMEQEIKAYEAQNDTGNKVLDTVLTGKSLTCRTKNIQLTCVADGTVLDFMDVMDISNLFGNALDNAIDWPAVRCPPPCPASAHPALAVPTRPLPCGVHSPDARYTPTRCGGSGHSSNPPSGSTSAG